MSKDKNIENEMRIAEIFHEIEYQNSIKYKDYYLSEFFESQAIHFTKHLKSLYEGRQEVLLIDECPDFATSKVLYAVMKDATDIFIKTTEGDVYYISMNNEEVVDFRKAPEGQDVLDFMSDISQERGKVFSNLTEIHGNDIALLMFKEGASYLMNYIEDARIETDYSEELNRYKKLFEEIDKKKQSIDIDKG